MPQSRTHFIRAYEKSSQNPPFTRSSFTFVNEDIRIIQFFSEIYFYTACECGSYTHVIYFIFLKIIWKRLDILLIVAYL